MDKRSPALELFFFDIGSRSWAEEKICLKNYLRTWFWNFLELFWATMSQVSRYDYNYYNFRVGYFRMYSLMLCNNRLFSAFVARVRLRAFINYYRRKAHQDVKYHRLVDVKPTCAKIDDIGTILIRHIYTHRYHYLCHKKQ